MSEAENNLPTDPNAPQDPSEVDPRRDDGAPDDPNADPPSDPPRGDDPPPDPNADPPGDGGGQKKTAQDRIRELVAERSAVTEYAEYWRQRAMEGTQKPPEPEKEESAPKLADYNGDTEKWAEAYAQWTDKRVEKCAAKAAEQQVESAREADTKAQAQAKWKERAAKFAEQKPDFDTVVSNPKLPVSEAMSEVITSSEKGPELAYHLGTNPAEAARIARMPPAQAAAALGRIEATFEEEKPPPNKKPSSAPPPPNPVGGGGTPKVDLENCSLEEYLDHRLGRKRKSS